MYLSATQELRHSKHSVLPPFGWLLFLLLLMSHLCCKANQLQEQIVLPTSLSPFGGISPGVYSLAYEWLYLSVPCNLIQGNNPSVTQYNPCSKQNNAPVFYLERSSKKYLLDCLALKHLQVFLYQFQNMTFLLRYINRLSDLRNCQKNRVYQPADSALQYLLLIFFSFERKCQQAHN